MWCDGAYEKHVYESEVRETDLRTDLKDFNCGLYKSSGEWCLSGKDEKIMGAAYEGALGAYPNDYGFWDRSEDLWTRRSCIGSKLH